MRTLIGSAVAAAMLAAGTAPAGAVAQDAVWRDNNPPVAAGEAMPARQAEVALAGYADCLVKQRSRQGDIARFLRTIPDSAAGQQVAFGLIDADCLTRVAGRPGDAKTEMRVQAESLRQALYPALYRREFRAGAVPGLAAVPPLALPGEFDGDSASLPASYRPVRALGDCVARAAPDGARALVMAKPYSAQADAAIDQIRPGLTGCIGQGLTIHLNRSMLRASVGEALYKLSRAAQVGTPAARAAS